MTLNEFNILSLQEKQSTIMEKGVFLVNIVSAKERCNCYAIDKFFVELVYNSEKNSITDVRSFKTGHFLNKYSIKF